MKTRSEKISCIYSKKVFVIFWEMELFPPKNKQFLICPQKILLLNVGKWNILKSFLCFSRELYALEK